MLTNFTCGVGADWAVWVVDEGPSDCVSWVLLQAVPSLIIILRALFSCHRQSQQRTAVARLLVRDYVALFFCGSSAAAGMIRVAGAVVSSSYVLVWEDLLAQATCSLALLASKLTSAGVLLARLIACALRAARECVQCGASSLPLCSVLSSLLL